jgi:hypothetical protein
MAAERLMEHVSSEFLRLLTMAGMEAPADCHAHDDEEDDHDDVDGGRGGRPRRRGEGRHRPDDRLERRVRRGRSAFSLPDNLSSTPPPHTNMY